MLFVIHDEKEMEQLGEKIAGLLDGDEIIYLIGELGAGKTTLARGIARGVGYEGRVTSPTFTLMNIYEARIKVYHFDFYRLQPSDISDLGLDDYLGKDGICMIEWAQIGITMLPAESLIIKIELNDGDYERERLVSISARGEKYLQVIEELIRC